MSKSNLKPLRSAQAEVSAPEITVRARYRSAIGIDVHLGILVCCLQRQDDNHKEYQESRDFHTDRAGIEEFVAWCKECNPDIFIMESTAVLWMSPYEALEAAGFDDSRLVLVNARDVKAAVGRKTDRKDAARLAEYARSGHFQKSFIPPRDFRVQRMIAREYRKTVEETARLSLRYQKLLNTTGCRASTVFSNVRGKAASVILEAKINGDPELPTIIRENCKRLRATPKMIEAALNFEIEEPIARQLQAMKAELAHRECLAQQTMGRLRELQQAYEDDIKRLMTIPGVKECSARLIYAELCDNLENYFEDSEHFTSWLGICPGDNTSAGKQKSGKCPKGNKWLRQTLVECVLGFVAVKEGGGREKFQAYKVNRGHKRAVIAMAHFLARIIYSILTHKRDYVSQNSQTLRDVMVRRMARSVREVNRLNNNGLKLVDGLVVEEATGAILADLSNML